MYNNKVTFVLRQRETFYEKRKSPFFRFYKGPCIFFMGWGGGGGAGGIGGDTRKITQLLGDGDCPKKLNEKR